MKLHAFMTDPALCGTEFLADSWAPWRIVARLYDGDAALLTADERAFACRLLGTDTLPDWSPDEFYAVLGRRSGKSRFAGLLLTHCGAQDYRDRLAPGEWATAICVATDRRQARTIFGYCEGMIDASPMLAAELVNRTRDTIEFAHRTRIEIHTASFRAVRGYSIPLAVIDEAAFLRDERSAIPDMELARALRPALATLGGRLAVISSPHRKVGLLWQRYAEHYGKAA
jgi:hypothetical protein